MHEELANEKIHSLDVVSLVIVAGEGSQNVAELFNSYSSWLEELVFWEGSC